MTISLFSHYHSIKKGVPKMMRILLTLALAATAALAQTQSATPPPPSQSNAGPQTLPTLTDRTQKPDSAASVAPSTPVLTLHGACNNPQSSGPDCTAVVTKEQFDKLVDALNSNSQPVPPNQRAEGIPPLASDLCLWMLAKDPDDRPQSYAELRQAFDTVMGVTR